MTGYLTLRWLRRPLALAGLVALPALACTDALLNVTDPDIILQASSPSAALALHNGAVRRLAEAVSGTQPTDDPVDPLFMFGGLLTDEWKSGDTFIQRNSMDLRTFNPENTFNAGPFRNLHRVRTQGRFAIDGLRTYLPDSTAYIGRMFAFIAYAHVLLGEHYCNGVPLSSIAGSQIVFGEPVSNDSLFTLAIAHADSALLVVGSSAASALVQVANFAKVIKGRALLDRSDFAGAAAAVVGVPLAFHYDVTHSVTTTNNQLWSLNVDVRRYTLGEREGGNGLPYVSAQDPRLPNKKGPELIFDTAFPDTVIRQGVWGRSSPVTIASGIEAQLITAEAALHATPPDNATWLSIINSLRTNTALYPVPQAGFTAGPALTALADPGTPDLRVDRMFYERGFWLFGTGHRLGDMRRLVRSTTAGGYGRPIDTVYPTGPWFKGGNYSDALQMSIPFEEQNNPNYVHCADRNP
jgi:hypothetical protein